MLERCWVWFALGIELELDRSYDSRQQNGIPGMGFPLFLDKAEELEVHDLRKLQDTLGFYERGL